MIRPEDNIQFALEKAASPKKKEDKRTYPFSRAATSPLVWGAGGAGAGAAAGHVTHAVLSQMTPEQLKALGTSVGQLSRGRTMRRMGARGGLGAFLAPGIGRRIHSRAAEGRARKGYKGMLGSERRTLEALRASQTMSKKSSDNVAGKSQ